MGILVHKYGGTSVGTTEKIKRIAKRVIAEKEKGNDMVVVVSAMGKTTDYLVEMSKEIAINPNKREMDLILSTGEQVSIALLSMAFQEFGYDAIALTGFQAGIKTYGPHTKNKILDIDDEKIKNYLKEGKVVVVAGFQGVNENGDITTLGRGGSDTTAVAIAAKLGCPCHIYTDVDGIYSVDPRLYKEAKKLDVISYEEMMEMASLGAGVMEPRAIEIGCKYNIPIYVASSINDVGGTYIKEYDEKMEGNIVTGLSVCDDILMVTVSHILYNLDHVATLFEKLAIENVNVDMISQTAPVDGYINVSFTAPKDDLFIIEKVMRDLEGKVEISIENEITKISVVGIGMRNQSGVSISYTIDKKDKEKAVRALSNELNL